VTYDIVVSGKVRETSVDLGGVLSISKYVYVTRVSRWIKLILEKAHCSSHYIYLGATKIYN